MARYAFIMQPSLNVALEDQAVARLHRIGQRHPVTVFRLLTHNTLEKRIDEWQCQKRAAEGHSCRVIKRDEKDNALPISEVLALLDIDQG
jgi:hypothetical protein